MRAIRFYAEKDLECFPLYFFSAEMNHLQEHVKRKDGYPHHHLLVVKGGDGIVNVNGESYPVSKHDMIYIDADTPHEYYGVSDDFSTDYLTFWGRGVNSLKAYYGIEHYGVYRNKNSRPFEEYTKKIIEEATAENRLSALCTFAFCAVTAFFDEAYRKEASPIERVYNYIEANYSKIVTLDELFAFYPYSKSKLCHDFKSKYGSTIFGVILKMRLRKADFMIKSNTNVSDAVIAKECGFNDVSYFCKMYKKEYGHSPKTR